jgi:hypothetical protein
MLDRRVDGEEVGIVMNYELLLLYASSIYLSIIYATLVVHSR